MNVPADIEVLDEECRITVLDDRITRSEVGIMVDDVSSVSMFSLTQVDKTCVTTTEDTILIVEDEAIVAGSIERQFQKFGTRSPESYHPGSGRSVHTSSAVRTLY